MSENKTHFYSQSGQAIYDIGIKEARANGYYYGVTSVTKMWPKTQLDDWKMGQAILRTIQLPKFENEPEDSYIYRIKSSLSADLDATADAGSAIHEAVENYLYRKEKPLDPKLLALCEPAFEWADKNIKEILAIEKPLVSHRYGYAGRTDLIYLSHQDELVISDWKSRDPKKDDKGKKKVYWYDTQPMQLVAYLQAYREQKMKDYHRPGKLISIVIDRNEPDLFVREWTQKATNGAWRDFHACLGMLTAYKDYAPAMEAASEFPSYEDHFKKFDEKPVDMPDQPELPLA